MNRYQKKLELDPTDNNAISMLDFLKNIKREKEIQENDPEWQKNNMEYDMRVSKVMVEKVRKNEYYAQNLYAAMCNNEFIKNEVWPLLQEVTWGCSWRTAGGIVADMRGTGDYIDWYCSGIKNIISEDEFKELNPEQQEHYLTQLSKYVTESEVTDEIRQDLYEIGWLVLNNEGKIEL